MLRVIFSIALSAAGLFAALTFLRTSQAQISKPDSVVFTGQPNTQTGKKMTISKAALAAVKSKFTGVEISVSSATGAAAFIRVKNNSADLAANVSLRQSKRTGAANFQNAATAKSKAFFRDHAGLFGIEKTDENLQVQKSEPDETGGTHQTFQQYFGGVPVFAGIIKTHFDKNNRLYAVGGSVVPDIAVDVAPQRSADEAAQTAIAKVAEDVETNDLKSASAKLYVFRTNLAQGVPGADRLVWEITVTDENSVREFVYIDAHSGKFVDQYTGTPDALTRRAYDGQGSANPVPPNYPATPFWVEGQAFPTGNNEADNMIASSGDTYNFYKNAFGRDSFNATGGVMDSIFNRGNACPNASWNGKFISFCPGLTSDDVTAHEWSHAYTEYTQNLVYAWQPGALNEGYSDIFGETVDRLNNRDNVGNSATDPARNADVCSTLAPVARRLKINSPAAAVDSYNVGWAFFGPDLTTTPAVTADIVPAFDAADAAGQTTTDGCSAFTNAAQIAGKIAFIDRGSCSYKSKVLNAQNAGAVGVVVTNTAADADSLVVMPDDSSITAPINIPSVLTRYGTGSQIRSQLANSVVNATLTRTNNSDASTRWLIGEDDTGQLGILRDMYNPGCYTNPGKVSDAQYYTCSTQDRGGIHGNSGIVNHAYALLVDGGTYNGQTISAVGLTKAAHIYFRAESIYQTPVSDFAFHADALEQSANDLIGVNLNSLTTGAPSGEIITAADAAQIHKATLAVELRTKPAFCNFQPLLAKSPPAEPICNSGNTRNTIFSDNFEGANQGWTTGTQNTSPGNSLINWAIVANLPENRTGSAYFVSNPDNSCDPTAQDQTALRFLKSPLIQISTGYVNKLTFSFEHSIATEAGYDGGQLLYSVNGAAFALVPAANFVYNAPNATLVSGGNSNPRAGQTAWTGADGGSVIGSFGKTTIDLTGLANAGDNIQFRWDFGNDSCSGSTTGWYVDNVSLNACFLAPTAANISISGRVTAKNGRGIANASLTVTDPNGAARTVESNSFGNFSFNGVKAGETYVISVSAKRETFAPQILSVTDNISGLNFTAR